jgi:hypothetical protein
MVYLQFEQLRTKQHYSLLQSVDSQKFVQTVHQVEADAVVFLSAAARQHFKTGGVAQLSFWSVHCLTKISLESPMPNTSELT